MLMMEESEVFEALLLAKADLRDAFAGVNVREKIRATMLILDGILEAVQRTDHEILDSDIEEVLLYG